MLAVPRRHALSFRDLAVGGGPNALTVVKDVTDHLQLRSEDVIWFEHGPSKVGTVVGCGLDHAHVHILVQPQFGFDAFVDRVRSSCDLCWSDVAAADGYAKLDGRASYLIAGSGEQAIVAQNVEVAGSQFFRRVVAGLAARDDAWNYKQIPHLPHIEQTIAIFRQLESAAHSGL